MQQAMSYVILTPYSVEKSRTGGVVSRLLSQTDLELVAAQVITPDEEFVKEYAASIRSQDAKNLSIAGELLARYIERNMAPSGGRAHRFMLLIFKGEDPYRKLSNICGVLFPKEKNTEHIYGETIRDTYADYILDPEDHEKMIYFEPAVLTPRIPELAIDNFKIFVKHFKKHMNIVSNMTYPDPTKIERTLVILKPDNWNYASSRPGTIIDMFSRTGLRIVGTKVFRFSLNQALAFYGPVENSLKEKLAPIFAMKAKEILEREFSFSISNESEKCLADNLGKEYAKDEFLKIVEFMCGRRPATCPPEEADQEGDVKCMIIVYEGESAIDRIREVLGPTDPLKAPSGTVRRDFGSNVMVNTAHASDSAESYAKEKKIVKLDENSLLPMVEKYLEELDNPS